MGREEMIDQLVAAGSVPLGTFTEEELSAGPDRGVPPSDELNVIRSVRRVPAAVVFAGQQSFVAVLHGFREARLTGTAPGISGFLEERIDQAGTRHFTVRTAQNAVDTLTALADPSGDAPADPLPGSDAPEDAWRAVLELGPGVTRLDARHSRPGGTRRIQASLLVQPGKATAVWAASGIESGQPRLFAVTADGLRQVVRDALCDPSGDLSGDATATAQEGTMTTSEGPFRCPVCGYPGLLEPPRTAEDGPSYEICPSCGFEFGVTDDDRGFSYAAWRQEWIADGMRWWSTAGHGKDPRKPRDWDPYAQLLALTESESEADPEPGSGDAGGQAGS